MDEVMAFAWANSPSMDIPFSDKSMALRASPNGYPALVIREVQMDEVITFRPKTANCTEYCEDDKSATLTLGYHYGDGGDAALILNWNNPKFGDPCYSLHTESRNYVVIALEGNGARPSHQGAGYSADGRMFTLNTIEKHAVCYGISSFFSNAMLSDNPNSGIYEAKTSRCLDLNGGNPACHQGGMIIVYPNVTGSLCAKMDRGLSGQDGFNDMIPVIRSENMEGQRKYVIRRLTPTECARLQGFPDWWVDGADGSDSAIYKMWGNGIALPCAADVIGRIVKAVRERKDENDE